MGKYFIPTDGPEEWKYLLAEPEKHWKTGHSAKALAYCWEEAQGFPKSIARVFSQSQFEHFQQIEFVLGFPEYRTPLPGGRKPSQSDIFLLARSGNKLITIAVEGKVDEPFGQTVSEWQQPDSQGKRDRLGALRRRLGLLSSDLYHIRYQLLHRTASALIEAERFRASCALMLVHSFNQEHKGYDDYEAFLQLFGRSAARNQITFLGEKNEVGLYASWVTGERRYVEI